MRARPLVWPSVAAVLDVEAVYNVRSKEAEVQELRGDNEALHIHRQNYLGVVVGIEKSENVGKIRSRVARDRGGFRMVGSLDGWR